MYVRTDELISVVVGQTHKFIGKVRVPILDVSIDCIKFLELPLFLFFCNEIHCICIDTINMLKIAWKCNSKVDDLG